MYLYQYLNADVCIKLVKKNAETAILTLWYIICMVFQQNLIRSSIDAFKTLKYF